MPYYTGWSRYPLLHLGGQRLCPVDLAYETLWKEDAGQTRKNCQLHNIQKQKSGGECIWNFGIQIQGDVDNHGSAPNLLKQFTFFRSWLVVVVITDYHRSNKNRSVVEAVQTW